MTLLTRTEAAAFCRRKIRSFEIRVHPHVPHVRKGREYLYRQEDLEAWLETQKAGNSSGGAASRAYASAYKGDATRSAHGKEILERLRKRRSKSTRTSSRAA